MCFSSLPWGTTPAIPAVMPIPLSAPPSPKPSGVTRADTVRQGGVGVLVEEESAGVKGGMGDLHGCVTLRLHRRTLVRLAKLLGNSQKRLV